MFCINEKNGTQKIMIPNEARQRNLCYSGNYADLNEDWHGTYVIPANNHN